MSRNHRSRTLGFERLENRRLLAGDVNYSVANNTLTLTGDNAANAILITSSSDGVILVKGLVQVAEPVAAGQVPQPTTVGGTPSHLFPNINSIVVNFNGGATSGNKGDDAVVIGNLSLTGSVNIHTSDGDDIVALGQFDNSGGLVDAAVNSYLGPLTIKNGLTINVQSGDNKIVANGVTIQGPAGTNLGITGGDGNDAITLANVSVTHATSITDNGAATLTADHFSTNVLALSLGIGNDTVSFSNSTINTSANINTNFGNDVVNMDHVIVGTLSVNLGPGNDGLTLTSVTSMSHPPAGSGVTPFEIPAAVSIDAGDGNDSVALNTVDASPLTIMLGAGNDQLTIDNTRAGDTLLSGGDGADTMSLDTFAANSLNILGGPGNDTISIHGAGVATTTSIDAGAGSDNVTLTVFNSHALTIALGAGNDSAWLQDVTIAAGMTVDGGTGNDSVVLLDSTSNTLMATMDNGSDHLSMAGLTVHKKSTIGGGNGNDLFSSGDGNTLGTTTRRLFEASNHSVPAPLTGI